MQESVKKPTIISDTANYGRIYFTFLLLSSACGVLSLVIGDIFDKAFGFLTLFATISFGFTLVAPWMILSIIGAEITTFFLLGIFESIRFGELIMNDYSKTTAQFFGYYILKISLHVFSLLTGAIYLQKIHQDLIK